MTTDPCEEIDPLTSSWVGHDLGSQAASVAERERCGSATGALASVLSEVKEAKFTLRSKGSRDRMGTGRTVLSVAR
jgi:hypothetical protein